MAAASLLTMLTATVVRPVECTGLAREYGISRETLYQYLMDGS